MKDEFDYKEFEQYVKKFEKMTKSFDAWLRQFLLDQANRCIASAKRRTPVDTGALRASWGIGSQELILLSSMNSEGKTSVSVDSKKTSPATVNMMSDVYEITVWNGMLYASYVEYGTSKQEPKYMLTLSLAEVELAMPKRFESEFRKFLKDMEVF